MSRLTIPKIFMAGGAVGFGYYMVMRQHWFPNPYKTREVQNIEDRFTAGGGAPNHTPAVATRRGDSKSVETSAQGPGKGPQSEFHKNNFSGQQSDPVWPAKFYEQQNGNPKGK